MRLTVIGSADAAGIPVHGCGCTLCRQARAVRHLRRRPTSLMLQEGDERLLIDAGDADVMRSDWREPPSAALLSGWDTPRWAGLVRLHLGRGKELPLFGPERGGCPEWLAQTPGPLSARAVLLPGQEIAIGRFQVLPFALAAAPELLGYGIRSGEQRLAYVPAAPQLSDAEAERIGEWQPQVLVLASPTDGRPADRLEAVVRLHELTGRPTLLLAGIDHHLDPWLTQHAGPLPSGIRTAQDAQRLDMTYLKEYRRLAEGMV